MWFDIIQLTANICFSLLYQASWVKKYKCIWFKVLLRYWSFNPRPEVNPPELCCASLQESFVHCFYSLQSFDLNLNAHFSFLTLRSYIDFWFLWLVEIRLDFSNGLWPSIDVLCCSCALWLRHLYIEVIGLHLKATSVDPQAPTWVPQYSCRVQESTK